MVCQTVILEKDLKNEIFNLNNLNYFVIFSTKALNPCASFTAISANIFLLIFILAFFKPFIN